MSPLMTTTRRNHALQQTLLLQQRLERLPYFVLACWHTIYANLFQPPGTGIVANVVNFHRLLHREAIIKASVTNTYRWHDESVWKSSTVGLTLKWKSAENWSMKSPHHAHLHGTKIIILLCSRTTWTRCRHITHCLLFVCQSLPGPGTQKRLIWWKYWKYFRDVDVWSLSGPRGV